MNENPQTSLWLKLATKHKEQSLKRQSQEERLQRQARSNYQRQLKNQIQYKKFLRQSEKELEKNNDKQMVRRSLQNQEKILAIERQRNVAIQQQKHRRDMENLQMNNAKKQKQQLDKKIQSTERLKKYQYLYEPVGFNKIIQYPNGMISPIRKQVEQKLMKKSSMGSNFEQIDSELNKKTALLQRKQYQWDSQLINRKNYFTKVNQFEQIERNKKVEVRKLLADELRYQISQKNFQKELTKKLQLDKDKDYISQSIKMINQQNQQKKQLFRQNQKRLFTELHMQVNQKQQKKKQPYIMKKEQYMMNADLLNGRSRIVPGQTYQLDPYRKKQLETVARSMSVGTLPKSYTIVEENYLAKKGRRVFD